MADCPTPSKAAYADVHDATAAAARIRADDRGPAMEPYLCRCGCWHLSRRANLTARIRGALKEDR